ncbi:MAG: chromate transporter [Chloroflexi bacterium]|nr:chromate transporter [Chloroflexota bacterium]
MELLQLALVFLKIGALIFGGGMSMIAFIQQDVVYTYGWLTEREFVDAVAMGQITPGPIVISAVFIGFKVAGLLGSVLAIVSVILPSFLMTVVATRWLGRISRNLKVRAVLRGLAPVVVGLILAAAFTVGRTSITDVYTVLIALAALVLLTRFKVDTAIVVLGAAVIGYAFL